MVLNNQQRNLLTIDRPIFYLLLPNPFKTLYTELQPGVILYDIINKTCRKAPELFLSFSINLSRSKCKHSFVSVRKCVKFMEIISRNLSWVVLANKIFIINWVKEWKSVKWSTLHASLSFCFCFSRGQWWRCVQPIKLILKLLTDSNFLKINKYFAFHVRVSHALWLISDVVFECCSKMKRQKKHVNHLTKFEPSWVQIFTEITLRFF